MRDYAVVVATIWTGDTGKRLRAAGRDAQVVALYLITCPSSNMIGLYYLPMPTLTHETGIPFEGASKALRSLQNAHFSYYDENEEVVFVPEMAKYQIAAALSPTDNRVKGVMRELEPYRKSRFFRDFYARYGEVFHLPEPKPLPSPSEAPPKPLRSQDQDQDQDQDEEKSMCGAEEKVPLDPPKPPVEGEDREFNRFWQAWPSHHRKVDRKGCLRHWTANHLDAEAEAILAGLEVAKASRDWLKNAGEYIPAPKVWLNQRRWEALTPNTNGASNGPKLISKPGEFEEHLSL